MERYSRQLALPGMSKTALERLQNSKVVIFGLSASGCSCATYLASSGVGELVLIEHEMVQPSDLSLSPLFLSEDVDTQKGRAAATRLSHLNENLRVRYVDSLLTSHNADSMIQSAHIVLDSLDNWQDKLLLSDVCMQLGKTLVHVGVRGFEFQIYTMIPGRSACLRCVFSRMGIEDVVSASSQVPGSLGPVDGMAGCFQAVEAIKILAGLGPTPGNHLIRFDSLRRDFDDLTELGPRSDCPDCGTRF